MLNLKQTKEYSDGTADYQFEFDKKFEEYYFEQTGRKTIDLGEVKEFIVKMLEESLGEEGK